jgi:4-hydroxybenzoate polyprenyltransferase
MSYDPEGIRTIPRRIGVRATKKLGILLMILASLLLFLRDDIDILEIVARGLMMIFVSLLIWKTPEKGSKYYASFWVEAMPIFWYLGILLLQTQI